MVTESRHGAQFGYGLLTILSQLSVEMVPCDERVAREAHHAWRRFGKGNHPAGLNKGDCWAYATARVAGEALLFKGGDFTQTDIEPAAW